MAARRSMAQNNEALDKGSMKLDGDRQLFAERERLRKKLQKLMTPILEERITPIIKQAYPDWCGKSSSTNATDDPNVLGVDDDAADGDNDDDRRGSKGRQRRARRRRRRTRRRPSDRTCTPCYSLLRRYQPFERVNHAVHHDGHALATVVVSLSDYGTEYTGGLFVSASRHGRRFLRLDRGDAVLHSSELLHGVSVGPKETPLPIPPPSPQSTPFEKCFASTSWSPKRWSWVIWYKDSGTCDEDFGFEWYKACAESDSEEAGNAGAGNSSSIAEEGGSLGANFANLATCQMLHATKVGATPGLSRSAMEDEVLKWNQRAAENGASASMVKVARAYLKMLPSKLPFDDIKASEYFRSAIEASNEPDAHFGMAQLLATQAKHIQNVVAQQPMRMSRRSKQTAEVHAMEQAIASKLQAAIGHLEEAARGAHPFAMFNLGIAHLYGYGVKKQDPDLAGEWFEASGLPEGLFARAMHARSKIRPQDDDSEAMTYEQRAKALGFGAPWRRSARIATGSGGAGGVDLNIQWPRNKNGESPPQW